MLILDDWGLSVLTATEQRNLLEILDDRQGRGATIMTRQLPVDQGFEVIGDPTLAPSHRLLCKRLPGNGCHPRRLVHNAHHLTLSGDSMRRKMSTLKTLADGLEP
jgi:DNA replication protein DnaC